MFYVGLDVHQLTSTYCILDGHGRQVKTVTVRGRWDRLLDRLRAEAADRDLAVCYEASLGYGALHERLSRFCRRVVVAHPGRLRLIFRSKRKNDRADAQKLATLLYLDQVPQVHVPSIDVRSWRELIEFRTTLIHKRTRCKNGLRALLRGLGIATPRWLWSGRGRAWLEAVELPTEAARLRRQVLLAELEHLGQQVARVTSHLDRMAAKHPGVALLRTIPGVGARTAEAVLAYIDDPRRFAKLRRIGAYLGLVPSQDASAGVNRLGHLTKQGPATVRRLLVQAAWRAVATCPALRAGFERIAQGRRDRRQIAITATAHKLARIMLAMLKTGECYRPAAA